MLRELRHLSGLSEALPEIHCTIVRTIYTSLSITLFFLLPATTAWAEAVGDDPDEEAEGSDDDLFVGDESEDDLVGDEGGDEGGDEYVEDEFDDPLPSDDEGAGRARDETGESDGGRLSSRWFWAGLALTVLSGGASVATGVTALRLNREYLVDQGDELLRQRGMEIQLVTNVLFGLAGGFALASTLLAIFTDWSSLRRSPPENESLRSLDAALLLATRH